MRTSMARILVLLAFLAVSATSATPANAGVNLWTPIGPDGGEVTALEAHPTLDNIVYAGTRGGVFKSTDHGTTWRLASRGLQNRRISSIAVAPSRGSVVYAGTWDAGVFFSNDGGASWRPTPGRLDPAVLSLDVDPRDARKVWAGSGNGVYWSDDAGATWHVSLSDRIARVLDIEVDPRDPDTVYIADEGLEDFGVSGVLKTTDGAATWELLLETVFSEERFQIALDPTTPGLLYASTRAFASPPFDPEETWRSADGGATWELTAGNYPLAVDRLGVVYAGDRRSDDHGQTWTTIAGLPAPQQRTLYYATSAGGPGRSVTLWAGTQDDGVFRSRDSGAGWQPAGRGLHATGVTSLVINPRRPRVMYAAAFSSYGVRAFKTEDAGAGWRLFDNLGTQGSSFFTGPQLALSPVEPARVYITWRHENGLMRTDHGGVFWVLLRGPGLPADPFAPYQVVADPTAPDTVYLVGTTVGTPGVTCSVARSTDRGHTFQCLSPFGSPDGGGVEAAQARLFADPARPGRLWVPVRRDRFWRSDDRGTTWTAVRPRGLERAGVPVWMAFDPTRPNRLYLTVDPRSGDRTDRVWRSDDGGLTWASLGNAFSGLPPAVVETLLVDPQQPSNLFAAAAGGVYWSRNGGRTWSPLVNGLPGSVTELVMDPRNPRQLYALTGNLGIYAFTRQ